MDAVKPVYLNIGWFTVNCEMKFSTKHRYVYLRLFSLTFPIWSQRAGRIHSVLGF